MAGERIAWKCFAVVVKQTGGILCKPKSGELMIYGLEAEAKAHIGNGRYLKIVRVAVHHDAPTKRELRTKLRRREARNG